MVASPVAEYRHGVIGYGTGSAPVVHGAAECAGFSGGSMWAQELLALALELGLRSCGTQVLPLGMWNLPEPGNEPISSTLASGFLSNVSPPGKSQLTLLILRIY